MPEFKAARDFKLSITKALADQLQSEFELLVPATLGETTLDHLDDKPGVYILFREAKRVYVGKASKSLLSRLRQHYVKLLGRTGINLDDISFCCLYMEEDLDAVAPERQLIKRYRELGEVPWNFNGFGNNDPGRRRDHSLVKAMHFDATYPINLDVIVELPAQTATVSGVLKALKERLPYLFRFDKSAASIQTAVTPSGASKSARALFRQLIEALPPGWQLTALPGYAILYKEDEPYESAQVWWRRKESGLVETPGSFLLDESGGAIASDDEGVDEAE